MMKELLSNLFRVKKTAEPTIEEAQAEEIMPESAGQKEPAYPLGNGFYWEYDQVRNGLGGYKDVGVYLLKMDDPAFRRCIVDHSGRIQNFPGFEDSEWRKALEYRFAEDEVNFVFWISPYKQGRARVRWLVQPDGRYFADEDGYGAEHCEEITMYSELDEEGRFTKPFSQE